MNPKDRLRATAELLVARGWNAEAAETTAGEAVENGSALLEQLCFLRLAEHLLARIHNPAWVSNRARNPESSHHELIRRLLDSGASAEDLALFARVMQRQYLSDLACLLDGSGIYGTPRLPVADFRVFAVDQDNEPVARLDDLHEALGFQSVELEMKQSRQAAGLE